ncbi:MAG: hypothetical protein NWE92_08120 [Candidatus Bathyarchaeota archaeon]|nr:hypothetical protein [Candidatus Bathyarchaeota archaeon]
MTGRKKLCINAIGFTLYVLCIGIALSITILWLKILITGLIAAVTAGHIYALYRYRHANKQQKQKRDDQKTLYRYYYDRWYTPADSTRIEHEKEKLKKLSRKQK